MASTAGANVVIKLDIKGDKNVKNRLDLMAKRFEALDKSSGAYGKNIDNMSKSHDKFNTSLKATRGHLDDLNRNKFPTLQRRVESINPHLKDMNSHFKGISRSTNNMSKHLQDSNKELSDMGKVATRLRKDHLEPLDTELKNKKKDFADLNKEVDKSSKTMKNYQKETDRTRKNLKGKDDDGGIFGKMFGRTLKFMKIFGIEFGVMTAAVGAFRGALWLGQQATQLWSSALQGLGAAAGVAVAALAGVLAAQRELARAQMGPLFELAGQKKTGQYNISSLMSGVLDSEQYAMFDQAALMQSMRSAQRANVSTNNLRGILDTVGNFAIVADNPKKALTGLSEAFITATKEGGKFSKDTFKTISDESPEMAKGFEEIYGGAEKFKSALAGGKVTVADFTKALNDGSLKSLAPFKGALDEVNDTLIGRFKGALTDIKGKLTELGGPLVDLAKGPLAQLKEELGLFLFKVGPTIQKTMATIFGGGESITMQRMLDKLANLINSGMPKLIGLGGRLKDMFGGIGKWFGKIGGWLEKASTSWDSIFENILKPIGVEVWKTIEHAIKAFNDVIGDSEGYSRNFGDRLHDIFEAVRKLIDGFSNMKRVLAPVIDSFTRMLTLLTKILDIPGFSTLAAFGLTGMMLGKGKGGPGGGKGGMLSGIGSMFMMPFGGWGGGPVKGGNGGQQWKDWYGYSRSPGASGGAAGRMQSAMFATRMTASSKMRGMMGGQWNSWYDYSRSPGATGGSAGKMKSALFATKATAKGFWQEGGKQFMKSAAPTLLAVGASYVGGYISGHAKATDTGKQALGGALSGAGQGAMMGAALGSFIPGVGTGIGAAAGGIIGGIAGFFGGKSGAEKAKKQEREDRIARIREAAYGDLRANDLTGLLGNMAALKGNLEALKRFPGLFGAVDIEDSSDSLTNLVEGFDENIITPLYDRWSSGDSTESDQRLAEIITGGSENLANTYGKDLKTFSLDQWFATAGGNDLADTALGNKNIQSRIDMLTELSKSEGLLNEDQMRWVKGNLNANKDLQKIYAANPDLTPEKAKEYLDTQTQVYQEQSLQVQTMTTNMQLLSKTLGVTNGEALKVADSAGLVLNEKLLTLTQVLATLGYGADETANRINAATRMLRDALSGVEERRTTASLNEEYNRTGQYLADTNWAGNPEGAQAAVDDFVEAWLAKQLALVQSDDMTYEEFIGAAGQSMQAQLGVLGGPGTVEGAAFQRTSQEVLANIGNTSDFSTRLQYDPKFGLDLNSFIQSTVQGRIGSNVTQATGTDQATNMVMTYLRNAGIDTEGVTDSIQTMISGEYNAQLERTGRTNDDLLAGLKEALSNITVTLDGTLALTDEAGEILGSMNISTNNGDTTSARLSRTLAKHAALTDSIPGNRTITSAFRTNNLGSPSSDHVTGNAYDLTGQNLGQYADAVNGAGGFAEFHGAAGGRHLHVVPPQGDTANPASVGGAGGGVVINAPITVNARDGESAQQIARIVMSELAARERSARERV